jgi:non-ribosomal peptide synthase protein (TIGR01720 family)
MRVARFSMGMEQPARLLIVVHHLVVDGVSWRILLEDFQTLYQQIVEAQPVQLPAKTTSFKQWSQSLLDYAQSPAVQPDLDYWTAEPYRQASQLPVDFPDGKNTQASAATLSTHLSEAETQALLQTIPAVYHTQIHEVLLTALVQVLAQWTEKRPFRIDLEGHGREDLWEGIDVSRTVGWFTSIYPLALKIESTTHPDDTLKTIKEKIRNIPKRGISYGLLRYLAATPTQEQLRSLPPSDVLFNYLGQFDQFFTDSTLFRVAQESSGLSRSPKGHRSHLLSINGMVVGGKLQLQWTYSEALHCRTTIETVAQSCLECLRTLIAHCQSSEAGGFTPSDFPLLQQLNQSQLDQALSRVKF